MSETREHHGESHDPTSISGARGDAADNAETRSNVSANDHVDEKTPPPPKLTKKQKVKRHCGKFMWWYIIGNILFLAILLPIIFMVVLPAIVQLIVNQNAIPIDGGGLEAIDPETLSVSLKTKIKSPLPARIDPWQLFLYQKETPDFSPFLNITLPESHVNGNTPISLVNQTARITNMTELVSWFGKVFDEETVPLSIEGSSTIHLGALHSRPHLKKTIDLPGLRGLQGFSVTDLKLLVPALPNGNNLKGTVQIPNWGHLTIGLGNITFNLVSGSSKIGLVTVYDVVLPPGNVTKNFEGKLYINDLINNFGPVFDSQSEALGRGNIQLNFTGNTTIHNGQHLKFFEEILNKRTLSSEMPALTLITNILSGFLGAGSSSSSSSKGGSNSILSVIGDVIGNTTLVEQVLDHWNNTETAGSKTDKRAAKGPSDFNLFKFGMKMAMLGGKL